MDVKKEIIKINDRNKRVEVDKAWEISWARRSIVAILTYLVIVVFFFFANLADPWINAIVPTAAFFVSTATLPLFKKLWMKIIYKK